MEQYENYIKSMTIYDNLNEIILFFNNSDLKWVQLYEFLNVMFNKISICAIILIAVEWFPNR